MQCGRFWGWFGRGLLCQPEDGIRDLTVTGVQTCALPIFPIKTAQLAAALRVTREHLSRQFAAGGAPNLKRVIDLARAACAADLLGNPGYTVRAVVRIDRKSVV